MTAHPDARGSAAGLRDRFSERGVLDRFIAGVRAGEGRALVVRGEPGVGKTALLDYLAAQASGCLIARAMGVQSEMELAFAALHQLCAPMLDHATSLPAPQRTALQTAFGLSAGPVPDRFLVGLAVLGLLSESAGERPLVCVVDDQQWLDHAATQALGFAGRGAGAPVQRGGAVCGVGGWPRPGWAWCSGRAFRTRTWSVCPSSWWGAWPTTM